MGMSFHDQRGCRTTGHSARQANAARQNARRGPDQPARYGDLTKKPLVLHITAAMRTSNRACFNEGTDARRSSSVDATAAEPGSRSPTSSSNELAPTNPFARPKGAMLSPLRRREHVPLSLAH